MTQAVLLTIWVHSPFRGHSLTNSSKCYSLFSATSSTWLVSLLSSKPFSLENLGPDIHLKAHHRLCSCQAIWNSYAFWDEQRIHSDCVRNPLPPTLWDPWADRDTWKQFTGKKKVVKYKSQAGSKASGRQRPSAARPLNRFLCVFKGHTARYLQGTCL